MALLSMDAEIRSDMNRHQVSTRELAAAMNMSEEQLLHVLRSDIPKEKKNDIRGRILMLARQKRQPDYEIPEKRNGHFRRAETPEARAARFHGMETPEAGYMNR